MECISRQELYDELRNGANWESFAACQNEDPELFFAHVAEPATAKEDRYARIQAVCEICPVMDRCLDAAYKTGERRDIRAGLNRNQRSAFQKEGILPELSVELTRKLRLFEIEYLRSSEEAGCADSDTDEKVA